MPARVDHITELLRKANAGDEAAQHHLWSLLYQELHHLAHRELLRERPDHTLSTTALIHETFLRLVDQHQVNPRNRAHFMALCCRAMHEILVDYARRRKAQKRGGDRLQVPLEEQLIIADLPVEEILALEEALQWLAARHERLARVVECRYFGGLSNEQTAEVVGVSVPTVERDWRRARIYLHQALGQDDRAADGVP